MIDKGNSLLKRLRSIAATQHPCPSYEDSAASLTLDQLRILIDNLKLTSVATIDIFFQTIFWSAIRVRNLLDCYRNTISHIEYICTPKIMKP